METYGTVGLATDDRIIRCMCCTCWINKATDTYSEYVIFIDFRRQQWLREHASMLLWYYSVSVVLNF